MIQRPKVSTLISSKKITKQSQLESRVRLYREFGNYDWIVPKHFETAHKAMGYLVNGDYVSDILFGGAAGGGKSYTGWAWLTVSCLAWKGINTVVLRKALNTITTSGLETFTEVALNLGLKEGKHWKFHGGKNAILIDMNGDFSNSTCSKIWFKGCEKSKDKEVQSLGSTLYAFGFVEEGGEVPHNAFDTLAHSRLGRCPKGIKHGLAPKCFITCNPSDNWVKSEFYVPFRKGNLQDHKVFINSFVDDNPFQTDYYKRNLTRLADKVQKKRLMYGDWEFSSTDFDLVSGEKISDLFYNDHVKPGRRRLSADIALQGKDKFTVLFANGLRTKVVKQIDKCGGRTLLNVIKETASEHGVGRSQIVFDGDGLGSYLEEFLELSNAFHNAARPIGDKAKITYDLLKTQCAYKLADLVDQGLIYIECDDPDLIERITREFRCLKRQTNLDGKLKLITKEEMKDMNDSNSTDFLDLWLMLMWFYLDEVDVETDVAVSVVEK